MIVYHGSNSNFKRLRISKSLVKHNSTLLNEGLGIYFSIDKEVARSYGKYIYTLEINDKCFVDFRTRTKCAQYIKSIISHVLKETGINISNYFSVNEFIDRMYLGGQTIFTIGHDIAEILNNTDEFYLGFCETKRNKIYSKLRAVDKNRQIRAYMFNYHIKNIGVIKSVDADTVRIISKENSYT